MYYHSFQIVFQEVPGEISICFSISGCPLRCQGCHSPFLWKDGNGTLLTEETYKDILNQYCHLATCVLFMGGEWYEEKLLSYLKIAKELNFKTCLYTGEDSVSDCLLNQLTWLKSGRWIPSMGGLDRPSTNQNFIKVKTNKNLNHLFLKSHDKALT